MSVGRNDPCPCGSGKKYKKCCLAEEQAADAGAFQYRRWRQIESDLIRKLYKHAAEQFGPSSIEEAWAEFHLWNEEKPFSHDDPIHQVFGPYFLFFWKIDPANTSCDVGRYDEITVAESLKREMGSRLSREEVAVIDAGNRRPFCFFEIMETQPGHGFLLKNVLTEEEFPVIEQSGSKTSQPGDIVFAALFQIGGRWQTLGMAPYLIPPSAKPVLMEVRKNLKKQLKTKRITDENLADFDIELREIFFDFLADILNPPMPELANTDGDMLLPQKLHFEIKSADQAFHALKPLAQGHLSEDELLEDTKREKGLIVAAQIPWFKTSQGEPDVSRTVLGRLTISGKKLIVDVNSEARAKKITKLIRAALGDSVRFITKVIEPLEGLLNDNASAPNASPPGIAWSELPPEAQAAIKNMADQHWAKWFDEKIPALNGKTPRQAAKTKEGRELLEALFHTYARPLQSFGNAGHLFEPNIPWLRAQLGLKNRLEGITMQDSRKILIGMAPQGDAQRLKSTLATKGIDIAIVHNASTCSSGCSIQLEMWAHPDDVANIQSVLADAWQTAVTDLGYDPVLATSVFDSEQQEATCPACGTLFATALGACSDCGLEFSVPPAESASSCETGKKCK